MEKFKKIFNGNEPTHHFFSPGRVNIIGEHIDYNGGLVMPAAPTLGIHAWVRKNGTSRMRLFSALDPNIIEIEWKEITSYTSALSWANYPLGMFQYLTNQGVEIQGLDMYFESTLPEGTGLSSSAAIEVLVGYIGLFLFSNPNTIDRISLALGAQSVENRFIGVNCGIMDQFAVAMGKENHAMVLDCATLQYEYVPFQLGDYELLLLNTNQKRELADSKYNERRSSCEKALEIIRSQGPFAHLVDVPLAIAEQALQQHPELWKRTRHVITEQQRVLKAKEAMKTGDIHVLGNLLTASHRSLQHDYEVTGFHLDTIVEEALALPGCLGARMTGAGFGGCAIALVHKSSISHFSQQLVERYQQKCQKQAFIYPSSIGNGVHNILSI